MKYFLIVYTFLTVASIGNIESTIHLFNVRKTKAQSRSLIYPPTSPTRLQFIGGIGIPVEDLYFESVTSGYVLKAEYFLPTKAEEFRLPIRPQTIHRRSINEMLRDVNITTSAHNQPHFKLQTQHYSTSTNATTTTTATSSTSSAAASTSTSTATASSSMLMHSNNKVKSSIFGDNFKNQHKTVSYYRWIIYRGIEMLLNRAGLPGRKCVLRSICEHATIPLHYNSGMLAEILHIILTPSTSRDEFAKPSDKEYLHAESVGRTSGKCDFEFSACPRSPLDKISYVFDIDE